MVGGFSVEERYNGHIIVVAVADAGKKSKWIPNCRILDEDSRKLVKDLAWYLSYDTREQAEKVGLLISKKWIDSQNT